MKRTFKTKSLLLASSAIVGATVFSATAAFAQIEDVADPGVALVTNPIAGGDAGKNLLLTTAAEAVQFDTTITVGAGDGVAIQAGHADAATDLELDNTGAAGPVAVTVDGDIVRAAGRGLNVDVEGVVAQDFAVNVAGDVNLGTGVLAVVSGANATGISATGDVTTGGIVIDGQGGGAASLTLNGDEAQTVSGDIVADTAAANTSIVINHADADVTFSGDIGSEGSITGITAADIGAFTVTDGKATVNGATDIAGNLTLTAGTSEMTNNGTMTVGGNLAGVGTLTNATNARATIEGNIAAASTIENIGRLTLNGASNAGTVNNAGVLVIGQPLTNTGTIDLASAGTTTVDMGALTDGQTGIAGGTANVTGTARILLNPNLVDTNTVTIADNTAATANGNLAANIDQLRVANALRQVELADVGGAVVATIGDVNTGAQTGSALGISALQGSKLNQAGQAAIAGDFVTADASFTATQNAIVAALTSAPAAAKAAAEQLGDATAAAGAIAQATAGSFTSAVKNISNRLASLRSGQTSVAAGNGALNQNLWIEGSASYADQDARKGAAGFDVDSQGVTLGYDVEVDTGKRVGVAVNYTHSDVDGDSAANARSKAETYLVSLYGDKNMGDSFVNGSVHFGLNNVETAQSVLGFGRMAGDYTTEQYGAAVEFGHNIAMGGFNVVPNVGLNYTHVNGETVTLRQGANAVTDRMSAKDLLVGKIGARVEGDMKRDSGAVFRPSAHANFLYDFAGDEVTTTRSFGGVVVQDKEANVAQEALNLGAAMTYESASKRTAVKVGYDATMRDEFIDHTGSVKVSFKF